MLFNYLSVKVIFFRNLSRWIFLPDEKIVRSFPLSPITYIAAILVFGAQSMLIHARTQYIGNFSQSQHGIGFVRRLQSGYRRRSVTEADLFIAANLVMQSTRNNLDPDAMSLKPFVEVPGIHIRMMQAIYPPTIFHRNNSFSNPQSFQDNSSPPWNLIRWTKHHAITWI